MTWVMPTWRGFGGRPGSDRKSGAGAGPRSRAVVARAVVIATTSAAQRPARRP